MVSNHFAPVLIPVSHCFIASAESSPAAALAGIIAFLNGLNKEIDESKPNDIDWHCGDIDLIGGGNGDGKLDIDGTLEIDNITDHKLEKIRAACLRCLSRAFQNGGSGVKVSIPYLPSNTF